MKTTFSFTDNNREFITIEAEITFRNEYAEFTISGDKGGSCGQIDFEPKNDKQQALQNFWKKHHLQKIYKEDWEMFSKLVEEIVLIEEEDKERKVTEDDEELFEEFDEPEKALVIALMLDLSINEIEDISNTCDNYWEVQGISYLFGTDVEMDEEWDTDLENYIDDCLEIPDSIKNYFDREAWKIDARTDGRAHSLNRYDGGEEQFIFNDTWYYAYRQ